MWNAITGIIAEMKKCEDADATMAVPPENCVGRRNRGFSDRDWIPSSACMRPPFSSFQHFATAFVGVQPSNLSSSLFGISSPR